MPAEEVTGKPDLFVFGDGSTLSFGTVVYIRWDLKSGGYWTTLDMAKCKITPKNRITVPRLELNGAVLGKRLREFVLDQLDMELWNVSHLIDSSTILGYVHIVPCALHKADSRLKLFEGVRISKIQLAGIFAQGRLQNWFWVDTDNNLAD